MTREEVMALSDAELCIKAAELAGWIDLHLCGDCPASGYPECKESDPQGWTECSHLEGGGTWETCSSKREATAPDYPHSIAAAWELVDKMVAAGHDVAIHSYQSAEDHVSPFSTWCTVDEEDELDSGGTEAPRAITRAFVLAMTGAA